MWNECMTSAMLLPFRFFPYPPTTGIVIGSLTELTDVIDCLFYRATSVSLQLHATFQHWSDAERSRRVQIHTWTLVDCLGSIVT
jgi:hypothetical protein